MSSRDMTINQIKATDKDFGAKHTIAVKGFKDGGRNNTRDLILSVRDELLLAINKLSVRVDNLENLVTTQFKKHGWIK